MKKNHVTWTNIWNDINILCPEEMKKNPCKNMSSNDSTINACMRDYLPILVKWHWDFVVVNLISIDFHPLWEKDTKN